VIVTESDPGAVAWIDLNTGKRTLISDASSSGPAMVPHAVVLDPVMTNRAFVSADGNDDGYNSNVVLSVNLTNGDRIKLSQPGTQGNATIDFGTVSDLAYDQPRNQLVLVDSNGLTAMSLADGSLVAIANRPDHTPHFGHGAALVGTGYITLDGDRAIAFGSEATGNNATCVYEVDLASGDVHELAALGLGKDPVPPSFVEALSPGVYDPASDEVIVLDVTGSLLRARLQPGDREFVSDALYGSGPLFEQPAAITDDPTRKRWIVADGDLKALIAVDKASGDRSVISDDSHGTGTGFGALIALDVHVDGSNDEIIVLDDTTVWSVDPISGDRTVIASGSVGSGASFANSADLVVDGTRAIVVGCYGGYPCAGQMIGVDLATGNRTVLSAQATGTGPIDAFSGIAPHNGKFLVSGDTMLLEIDAANGNRSVIADDSTGDGPALTRIQALGIDTYEDRAVLINEFDTPQKLLAVDLVTGDRTLLSDPEMNSQGPYPGILTDLLADAATHRLIIAEGWGGNDVGVLGVLLADRERTLISEQGHSTWNPAGMLVDPDRGLLYAGLLGPTSSDGGSVVSLDTKTMKRTVIETTSTAVPWTIPLGFAVDADANRLLGIDFTGTGAVVGIDLDDRKQTVLASESVGSGLTWSYPFDCAWDADHQRILLTVPYLPAIVALDGDGKRTAFSGGAGGGGTPMPMTPIQMALDTARDRLFVTDGAQIYSVALEDGTRAPFSGGGAGSGAALIKPGRIVLDSVHDRLVVIDYGDDSVEPALIAIALDDGARSTIARLPKRWYPGLYIIPLPMAYDETTEIAYVGALHALDTTTGESISIAGHKK
jgi:hypothetical protein